MKDQGSKIVAIDFGGYSFLPPSFFSFVTTNYILADRVNILLGESSLYKEVERNVNVLLHASYALVPYQSNDFGELIILASLFSLVFFPPQG